jgi:phage-related protein
MPMPKPMPMPAPMPKPGSGGKGSNPASDDPGKTGGDLIAPLIKNLPNAAKFAVGVAEAFVSRILPDWVNCLRNIESLASSIMSLFNQFHSGIVSHVKQAIYDLAGILGSIKSIISKCGLTEVAKKIAAFITKVYSGFGNIVIGAKIVINGVNIFHNLDDGLHAWKNGDWQGLGKACGNIVGYVI